MARCCKSESRAKAEFMGGRSAQSSSICLFAISLRRAFCDLAVPTSCFLREKCSTDPSRVSFWSAPRHE